jgi:RimJ/RimL family protein N-acetyltransferase
VSSATLSTPTFKPIDPVSITIRVARVPSGFNNRGDPLSFPIPSLETARFTLRLWTADDVVDLLDLDDDPDVVRYVGPQKTRPEREAEWRGLIGNEAARPCVCIHDKATGSFVGWAFLRPFRDQSGDWELGYRLRKAAWGQGIGTEVAQALMAWGWQQEDIHVIGAVYETPNVASRAIMLRVGMIDAGERLYFNEGILPYCQMTRPAGAQVSA